MIRKLNRDERGEYKALYEHYLFYVDRAIENIDRNGTERKYNLILRLMDDAEGQMDTFKGRAYGVV